MIFEVAILLDVVCCCFIIDAIGRKNGYDICNRKKENNVEDENQNNINTTEYGNPKVEGVSV